MIMSAQDARGPEEHEKTRHWSGAPPALFAQRLTDRAQPAAHDLLVVAADQSRQPVVDLLHPGPAALQQGLALGRRCQPQDTSMFGFGRLPDDVLTLEVRDGQLGGLE